MSPVSPTVPDDEDGHVPAPGDPSGPRPTYTGHPSYSGEPPAAAAADRQTDLVTEAQESVDYDPFAEDDDEDADA